MTDPFAPNERLTSPEAVTDAIQNGHKAGNLLVTDIMTRAAGDPQYLADLGIPMSRLEDYAEFSGQVGKALTFAEMTHAAGQGDYGRAGDIALDYVTGEALSKGYGDVIESMTRRSFTDKYGFSPNAESFHRAVSGQVAGIGADLTVEGAHIGADMMVAAAEGVASRYDQYVRGRMDDRTLEFSDKLGELNGFMRQGGIQAYNTHDGGLESSFGSALLGRPATEFSEAQTGLIGDIVVAQHQADGFLGSNYFRPDADSVDDIVRVRPDDVSPTPTTDGYLDINLTEATERGVDVTNALEDYAYQYAFDAERNNLGRDFDLNGLSLRLSTTVDNAEYGTVDLTDMTHVNDPGYSQFSGVINASEKDGGVVMIGKNGGIMRGSSHDDVILDGSVVNAGDGNDIVFVDYQSFGRVDAGAGNDIVIGGMRRDELTGGLGSDELRGGAGNDTLRGDDDNVRDILVGGEGLDNYYAGHNDVIVATAGEDKDDSITFNGITLRGPDLERYPAQNGDPLRGEHGETYELSEDGTLTVTHDRKVLTVENYEYGDFKLDMPIIVHGRTDGSDSSETPRSLQDTRLEAEPTSFSPNNDGTPLLQTLEYMRNNQETIVSNLNAKSTAGTITPEEEALTEILEQPEAAAVFGNLQESGVNTLNVRLDKNAPPEQNGINIYRAVGEASAANNIRMNDADNVQNADYERETQEAEMSYGIA